MPHVSVVIPAYQAAESLGAALESVAAQRAGDDLEVLVVDDRSTDATAEVARAAFARLGLSGGRVIDKGREAPDAPRNAGTSRNVGMRAASGTYVAFLDADDVWRPGKLERVLERFAAEPELVAVCHGEAVLRDGQVVKEQRYGTRLPLFWSLLLWDNTLSPSATVVRRDAALAAGGFSEDPGHHSVEDYDLWLRLARRGRFAFLDEALGEYRMEEGSLSRDHDLQLRSRVNVIESNFAATFRAPHRGLPGLARRHRLMRAWREVAWDAWVTGRPDVAARMVRGALAAWPLAPKTWALAALIARDLRRGGRA